MSTLRIVTLCVWFAASAAATETADVHYRQGVRELEKGDLSSAKEEFSQARAISPKFAPAYVGLALVEMEQGNFDGALALLKNARKHDKKLVDVYLARGRVYYRAEEKNWEKKALKEFDRAEKIAPGDDRVAYYRGMVYRRAGKFQEAVKAFGDAAALKGPMAKTAETAQRQVQFVQRALPEMKRSGLTVVLKDVVTRADMALLFLDEFDLRGWMKTHRPEKPDTSFKPYDPGAPPSKPSRPPEPNDIENHPHRHLIEDVTAMEVPGLGLYPDGGFGPDRPVTRAEFAQMMQGLMVLESGDRSLATRYFGEASKFPNMRADHFAYNAAVLCVQRGVLQPEDDGRFEPDRPVSGAEAVLGIKKALGL